jgi:hypothetical protein
MLRHQQDLIGPVAQFLTGLFPAVFGGNMEDVKTASGYALARDQALGRLGLVWRRMKQFYADVLLLSVDVFRKNRPEDAEIPLLGPDGVFDSHVIRIADLKGNICVHPEADETFPRLKSQQRGVLQQMFSINDPMIQRALTEPANLGYIKNVLGLAELVIPGEESRNKQLREIQQLLASAPIVIAIPVVSDVTRDPRSVVREDQSSQSTPGSHGPRDTEHEIRSTAVLPSVPVDQLLDDHAVEFEECKRWANSDAGQAARMTNPTGFANVRAHAEAHLRAMTPASRVSAPPSPTELHTTSTAVHTARESIPHGSGDRDVSGDHWVTIDGHHVLIHEPQGKQNQETPQSLAAQIPCHIRAAIAASIKASNSPTADDKKGGFHEEGGQWIITSDGKTVPVPAKPGPANPAVKDGAHIAPGDAVNPGLKDNITDLGGTWHTH